MNHNNILVWNPRGLNSRARRSVVKDVVVKEQISVDCLQETKLESVSVSMSCELTGPQFDYISLLAFGRGFGWGDRRLESGFVGCYPAKLTPVLSHHPVSPGSG